MESHPYKKDRGVGVLPSQSTPGAELAPSETQAAGARVSQDINDGAKTGMLFGFWYPAMLSRDLRAGAICAATLLELPLAVGRDAQGRAFALADLCPHRAMPLSFGRVAADTV